MKGLEKYKTSGILECIALQRQVKHSILGLFN